MWELAAKRPAIQVAEWVVHSTVGSLLSASRSVSQSVFGHWWKVEVYLQPSIRLRGSASSETATISPLPQTDFMNKPVLQSKSINGEEPVCFNTPVSINVNLVKCWNCAYLRPRPLLNSSFTNHRNFRRYNAAVAKVNENRCCKIAQVFRYRNWLTYTKPSLMRSNWEGRDLPD
jgi:hypothetical protein